jgi:hypothetical protein
MWYDYLMPNKSAPKPRPKLTDKERHKRFIAMSEEVGASQDPKDFERALKKVTEVKNRPL